MSKVSVTILNRLNKKDDKTPVYVMYTHKGEKFIVNTSVLVARDKFDRKSRGLKKGHDGNLKMDNQLIAKCYEKLENIVRLAHLEYEEPTVAYVKQKYFARDIQFNKNNIIELFDKIYLPFVKQNRREGTYRQRKVVLTHLEGFAKYSKKELTLKYCISEKFYEDFCHYLFEEKKMTNNSVGNHIKRIKTLLHFLHGKKVLDQAPDLSKFIGFKFEPKTIVLEKEELTKIKETDFKNSPHLEKYRDVLLVGVKIGLRISDLMSLKTHHLKHIEGIGDFIQIDTIKTNEPVEIPVLADVLQIMSKYKNDDNRLLPKITEQKFNKYIKEIGKLAGINSLIDRKRGKRNNVITETIPKYALLSSHTMRRTFITHCVRAGLPIQTIKTFTGHRDMKSFNRYLDLDDRKYKASVIQNIY